MMALRKVGCSLLGLALVLPPLSVHAEPASDPVIAKLIDEGLQHSEVMNNASALFDGIGARLTNSENQHKAQAWAMEKLKSYGLANVHEEPFPFGLGWNSTAMQSTWCPRANWR